MKNFIGFLAIIALMSVACQEVGPPVNMTVKSNLLKDTTYVDATADVPQPKMALLEELTGVRCVNCPRAHNTINTLQNTYPSRIIPIGIHTGTFSVPYENRPDFSIPEGSSIENLLGGAVGYPSGAINRKKFASEANIIISDQKWSNYIQAELEGPSPMNIELVKSYDQATRVLSFSVKMKINVALTGGLHLTAYLTEDNIVDHQLTPQGVDQSYLHKHVLRQCITPYNGVALTAPTFEANRVVIQEFSTTLLNDWQADNCKVVVFVHRIGEIPLVIQAASTNVI